MSSSLAQGSNGWLLTEAVRRALRKRARRLGWLSGMSLALAAGLSVSPAQAELPVICVTGATCGNSSSIINNALQGVSGIGIAGNTMTVNQNAANAVLHWRSFNISGDSSVNFVQPSRDSVALNRIYQNGASQIMGNLSANGRIYLINQNGIVFGAGAVVNVAGLIASSLDISSLALNADGETNLTLPGRTQQAAFRPFDDADGNALASGDITVGQGATITTADGGQVFMFAPNVHNYGSIATPGGQTVLAAGDSVYLASSADRNLRGIWVEVGTGGTVVNGVDGNATEADPSKLVGQIVAERGNVTLAGAAVNQLGRVTATTSVNEAGSIRLVARDGGRIPAASTGVDPVILSGDRGGTLTLGSNSRTEVQLAASDDTTVDSSRQPVSQVAAIGRQIVMERAASVVAPHGDVTFAACADCGSITDNSLATVKEFVNQASSIPDGSRIYVADGALIDVSGADINRSMQSNVLKVELRGDELADSELLRDSGLRGETVYIDIRRRGRHADGSEWVGSPIGDLSGWLSGIEKKVDERSLTGGTVNFLSRGDVLLNRGSTVDVSGGSITHADGYINTSGVLGADGRLYDIADAAPDREYVGVTGSGTLTTFDRRWGVMRTYAAGGTQGHFEPGYVEGKDAGTVQVVANRTVLEADIKAEVEVGRYQRRLSGDFNAATATALYRPYDELALSGTLILGQSHADGDQPDYAVGDVVISGSTTPQLAAQFDPLTDSLSDLGSTVRLSSDLFGAGRVGNLTLRANGTVSVAEGTTVVLPPGGEMDVTAGAIEVAGSITTHGGDIALTARPTLTESPLGAGLVVKSGATLDTSGIWVNDSINANGGQVGTDTLAIAGGSVRLHAQRNSLALQSGSVIDVSGGAQVTGSGKFVSGDAGIIDLGNTQPFDAVAAVTHMTLDGELRAYGFENGGSLSLDTTGVCIADAASACQHSNASTMWLNPEFFTTGGFGSFTIGSNRGGIEVAAGTTVTLRQRNRIAPTSGDVSRLATATSLDAIAGIGLLEDIDRHAVDLALNARPSLPGSAGYTSAAFADAANLVIGTGARIEADVGGNINLSSSSRLLVDGTVAAAAGNIGLALSSELVIADSTAPEADLYFEDQGIWLGDDAQLLARGAALTVNDDQGRVFGEVFDGGNISIDANRGHVVTSSGSLIDVSGTSAALSIKSDTQGHYRTDRVASAAGTVDIEASEAILVGGDLYGVSGDPGNLAGGTLRISLDSSLRNDPGQIRAVVDTRSMLPGGERTIEITQRALDIGFGDSTLPGYQGKAVVAAEQVAEGGFDALELNATTTWTSEGASSNTVHAGRIEFDGDVSLALARSIQMNAAVIASDGGAARVSAPIVTLGNAATDLNSAQYQAPVRAGTGTLQVDAGQIDVVGSSVLQGLAATTLQSSGDLRLIGVQVEQQGAAQPSLQGSLRTTGDVTLSAAQVYPTTLTQFTVAAGVDTDQGTLQITQNGTAGDALSAGGALTLSAAKVVQSGTVRAPFG
ncbi:MAG: filamentous hemagglutinin N-terminal domain-containing protein, partial [Pseudomonadota bacterium]|nr:filamentous hemagglutinin N-terminal domain-containing protein [Pseudomonadota bacterium]